MIKSYGVPVFKELENEVYKELIEILPLNDGSFVELVNPNDDNDILHQFGPFQAKVSITVPMWFAVYFRAEMKCTIINPSWLNKNCLESLVQGENQTTAFTKMPNEHYWGLSDLILKWPQDGRHPFLVKNLVQELFETRMGKLEELFFTFIDMEPSYYGPLRCLNPARTHNNGHIGIENVTDMEVCLVENHFARFKPNEEALEEFQKAIQDARRAVADGKAVANVALFM